MMATRASESYCPHCGNVLAKKVYDAHKRLYYNEEMEQWIKRNRPDTAAGFLVDDIDLEANSPPTPICRTTEDIPPLDAGAATELFDAGGAL